MPARKVTGRLLGPSWLVLAVGYAIGSVAVLPGPDANITTYVTGVPAAAVLLAAGLGLIAAGVATRLGRPASAAGALAVTAGVAWLAPLWVGWLGGPALARSLGAVATPLLLPALAHLALAYPSGRLNGAAARLAATAGWVAAGGYGLGQALFRNPLRDIRCWRTCGDTNVFLVSADPQVARAVEVAWQGFGVGFGMAVAAWAVWRLAAGTRGERSAGWAVLVPAAVGVAGEAAYAGALLIHAEALRANPVEPTYPLFVALFVGRGAALTGLALGLGWAVLREPWRRAAVARLADQLSARSLQSVLAGSLGDPTVQVGYWLPGTRQWVDASGSEMSPGAGGQRATTAIHRDGQPVAVVVHDPALAESRDLAAEIGSAARLAIDNERLRAEVLAQLEQVRMSRARIVAAGDAARRQLERDLHDGAQQRLLAVGYELRLARDEAGGDPELVGVLEQAVEQTRVALAELRELAHGIFPAVLDEAGLAPALWTLAETAAVPVELGELPRERLPPEVERAAYLVVAGAVAAAAPGTAVRVALARHQGWLAVDVTGAAAGEYVYLADRVGALGGTLVAEAGHLRAEIPCE